ncbi:hypothetical protein XH80_19430 [Bradyrhizobium sp. CCBAU 45384]|nr:hypothetical protein [Bradyrhizobium sp. CCBAU 45384]
MQLAVTARTSYHSAALDPSLFEISVIPKPGANLSPIERCIDEVIAGIAHNPASAEDFQRAKTRLIAQVAYAQDSQELLAHWYGRALTTGLCIEDVQRWPDDIRAVGAPQVHEATRKWLDKRRKVTGYLVKESTPQHWETL